MGKLEMINSFTRKAIIVFFVFFATSVLAISKKEVNVIRVIDGDTFVINESLNHIRMANIDAPEKSQAYGLESYSVLKEKIEGKGVTLDVLSKDKYGRLISNVYINGEDVNKYMVSKGAAWVYRYYCKDESYYAAEYKSKLTKKGLWDSDNPLPPWVFRAQHK
ncbi:TPA: thermonuclease family protein [Enterobacter roggenkampii]